MKNLKYKKIICSVIVVFGFLISTSITTAETISTSLSIPVKMVDNESSRDYVGLNDIFVSSLSRTVSISLSKNINLVKQDNYNLTTNSQINLGDTFDIGISPTFGDWNISNTHFAFDKSYWFYKKNSWVNVSAHQRAGIQVYPPEENGSFTVTNDNPAVIECVNLKCQTKKDGIAHITISSSGGQQVGNTTAVISYYDKLVGAFADVFGGSGMITRNISTKGPIFYGTDTGFGKIKIGAHAARSQSGDSSQTHNLKNMAYSFPPVTYTITVGEGNESPVTSCTGTTAITQNNATANWTYSSGDPSNIQTGYQVQLATKSFSDPSFVPADIAFAGAGTGNATGHTFTNLATSTTYYARIKTTSKNNGEGAWTGDIGGGTACSSFTTSPDDTLPGTFSASCTHTGNLVILSGSSSSGSATFTSSVTNQTMPVTYQWYKSGNPISGATGAIYTIDSVAASTNPDPSNKKWVIPISVRVTNNDADKTIEEGFCAVTISDNNIIDQCLNTTDFEGTVPVWATRDATTGNCSCANGKSNLPTCKDSVGTTKFYFDPNIAGSDGKCPLYLEVSNVAFCKLRNRALTYGAQIGTTSPNLIKIDDESMKYPIGTYTLFCSPVGDPANFTSYGTPKSCFSDSNIKEN